MTSRTVECVRRDRGMRARRGLPGGSERYRIIILAFFPFRRSSSLLSPVFLLAPHRPAHDISLGPHASLFNDRRTTIDIGYADGNGFPNDQSATPSAYGTSIFRDLSFYTTRFSLFRGDRGGRFFIRPDVLHINAVCIYV